MNDYPRDIDAYTWSEHLKNDALNSPHRYLTEELIVKTIEEGRNCIRSVNEPIRRKLEVDGVDIVTVLGWDDDELKIVSGWTEVNSIITALSPESRWSESEIEAIQELDYQNQSIDGENLSCL
jgi:hypothetical protein